MPNPPTPVPYSGRVTRLAGRWAESGWTVKLYGIGETGVISQELVGVARRIVANTLPAPAVTGTRYGLAFAIVHQARAFNQITVDWWECDNELRHRVFKALPDRPTSFEDITARGEAFCVWELAVVGFERDAWVDYVLGSDGPDWDRYASASYSHDA